MANWGRLAMANAREAWPATDYWRSVYEALALVNGHDPDVAVARHRRWCAEQGIGAEAPDDEALL